MTTSSTLTSCLALMALAAWPVSARAHVAQSPSGPALLTRVLAAGDSAAFRARKSLVVPIAGRAQATVTEEIHDGRGRSRILYRKPAGAAGREVVNDGSWVWEYDPADRLAVRYAAAPRPRSYSELARRILRRYTAAVGAGPVTWSGRRAWLLRIVPRKADRPRYTWWVDAATAVVLKRETFDAQGTLREVASYSSLSFGGVDGRVRFGFTPPSGSHVVYRSTQQTAATLGEARRMSPPWARPPAESLGDGFDFAGAQIVAVKGKPSLQTQYSDGLATVSLIQIPGAATLPTQGRVFRTVPLGATSANVMQMAPFCVLSWRSAGTTYSLIGDLGEGTLVSIARRIQ